MKLRTALLALFVVLTIALASTTVYEATSKNMDTTVTEITTQTVTTTTVTQSAYLVTFLVTPSQCFIQALCVNATLVNHAGQNLSVILVAWIRNATNGQNVTVNGGGAGSVGYASCTAVTIGPKNCYLSASLVVSKGTFEVMVFVISTDGKSILSPSVTINATLH